MKKSFTPSNPNNLNQGNLQKKKLGKYESNMRKALAASCGMGIPSTKIQGDAVQKNGVKGVHTSGGFSVLEQTGQSQAGRNYRRSKEKQPNKYLNQNYKGRAISSHEEKLKELKDMPKPNLPKSELDKSVQTAFSNDSLSLPSKTNRFTKAEVRAALKWASDENFKTFEKKEELLKFLSERLPKLKSHQIMALAKAIAFLRTKKKEQALQSLVD